MTFLLDLQNAFPDHQFGRRGPPVFANYRLATAVLGNFLCEKCMTMHSTLKGILKLTPHSCIADGLKKAEAF